MFVSNAFLPTATLSTAVLSLKANAPIAVLPPAVVAVLKACTPNATFVPAVVIASPALCPIILLASPVVIAVPAFLPITVFSIASVPLKLSPALPPIVVLPCASLPTAAASSASVAKLSTVVTASPHALPSYLYNLLSLVL